jgi:hypothetical protein
VSSVRLAALAAQQQSAIDAVRGEGAAARSLSGGVTQ